MEKPIKYEYFTIKNMEDGVETRKFDVNRYIEDMEKYCEYIESILNDVKRAIKDEK